MIISLLALVIAYFIGSFPSAYLLAKRKGKDIFSVGSGNMGAMNTARNLGYGVGTLVLILDIAKGALAAWLGLLVSSPDFLLPALLATIGVVAGHAWPFSTGFRGGKALATAWGTTLPLYPLAGVTALILLIVLSLTMKNRTNTAAVITCIAFPILVLLGSSLHYSRVSHSILAFLCSIVMVGIIIFKHWPGLLEERSQLQEGQNA